MGGILHRGANSANNALQSAKPLATLAVYG